MCNRVPYISFTFDDFPRSALYAGGEILEQRGVRATYYASLGLMGQVAPTGLIFSPEDISVLISRGHEIGCHTYYHHSSWETPRAAFMDSICKNQDALSRLMPGTAMRSFSYPINYPRPLMKRRLGFHYESCRGGGQIFQTKIADLNLLKAFFLEKTRQDPAIAKAMIDRNRKEYGWLIFATHDVGDTPSAYGCTPAFLAEIVDHAVASGAKILTVGAAVDALRIESECTG
jgi:peptidoglycan/xylan/chitin deacetylase (PgdA/CDA1 family)